jgi:outer membrane lipoprotein SlyB
MQVPKKLILKITVLGSLGLIGIQYHQIAPALAQQPSRSFCEEYARDYARRNSQGQSLSRAARGAAGGAAIGGIFGDAGLGAAIGASTGGIRGTIGKSQDYDYLYQIAFNDCMNGKVR